MADDGEWHTVTSNKHATTPQAPAQASKARRKSRHKINTPKQVAKPTTSTVKPTTAVKHVVKETKTSNPFHAVEDDDSDEEEEDGQVDPIDLPVPPYHTSIFISCPLHDCESPIPFLDTTSLVKHLKEEHQLLFKNLHHMYMALDAYLHRWAKELKDKPVSEFGQRDTEEEKEGKIYAKIKYIYFVVNTALKKKVYIIDPEKCELDKKIREEMQREKLVSFL